MESSEKLVDLSGERFDRFDVYESYFAMDILRELPRDVTLWVWGAYITVGDGDARHDLYVNGYAPVLFRDVAGYAFSASLYHDNGDAIREADGTIVTLARSWGALDAPDCHRYEFQGVSVWPHGECDFTVVCRGAVTIDIGGVEVIPNASLDKRTQPPGLPGTRAAASAAVEDNS